METFLRSAQPDKRIAMVVFSYYPADPRPRREAEALVEAGYSVDIICLRNIGEASQAVFNRVIIHRLPLQKRRGSKVRYLFEYAIFFILSFIKLTVLFAKKRFAVVHVHNMPDFLAFTALIPKLFRRKVFLDLHDPMPEVFMAKYGYEEGNFLIKILKLMERLSISFSDLVLTPNIAFRDRFISRGCPSNKIHIIMNSPQETIFSCKPDYRTNGTSELSNQNNRKVIMFHGTIVERHGLDLALYALNQLKHDIPNIDFEVYGEGDYVPRFLELVDELGLHDMVHYQGHVTVERIAEAIREIDLGIIPNRRSAFTDINMPTRIFEYLAMSKPVIAPRTPGIQDYFGEGDILYFIPNDVESLKKQICIGLSDSELRNEVLNKGMKIYLKHRWFCQKGHLINTYKHSLTPELT